MDENVPERRILSVNFLKYIYNNLLDSCRLLLSNLMKKFGEKSSGDAMNDQKPKSDQQDPDCPDQKDPVEKPLVRKKRQLIDAPFVDNRNVDSNGEYVEVFD